MKNIPVLQSHTWPRQSGERLEYKNHCSNPTASDIFLDTLKTFFFFSSGFNKDFKFGDRLRRL